MSKKDKTEKKLEEYPDVAADIMNAVLYDGEKVVKPEELVSQPTSVLIRDGKEELRERLRDLLFLYIRDGLRYAFIGIGNQSGVDHTLPLRVAEVDIGNYRRQVDHYMDQNRVSGQDAYEKGIHGDQKLTPVATVILYYGEEWTGPRSLWDMLELKDRERLKPCLLNYELNIVELGKDAELYQRFHSDFRYIVQYLAVRKDSAGRNAYYESLRGVSIRHYREFLDVMAALTSDARYRRLREKLEEKRVKQNLEREGDEVKMCWLLDMAEERGEARGMEVGRKEGEEAALLGSLRNLVRNMKISSEQAMELLGIPEEQREMLRKAV